VRFGKSMPSTSSGSRDRHTWDDAHRWTGNCGTTASDLREDEVSP